MFINFSDIPGHQNLFLDYLYEFENVKDFYRTNFRDKEEYLKKFKIISESQRVQRERINSIITEQYKDLQCSTKTQKNISSLKDKKTLVVATGQQLGILGGPLYTLYKIITAIRLSNYLSERFDEYNFVPVFWLEADDHDFDEIKSINIINENNDITKISYVDENIAEENKKSVGNIIFKISLNNFFEELANNLRDTEFKPELLQKLKSIYNEGKTFKQSFSELLFWFFDKHGLIIFDPQDKGVKEELKQVFKKEITDFRAHTEKLVATSAKLEETYHAQVKVRPINLFYNYDDGRYLVEPVDNDFRLRGKRKRFNYDELINLIENEPWNFSPNVLLRPICQDYIFPTAFYVAGPSEIAYFAQVMPLYDFYKIESPFIYPRSSATILEKNIISILEKNNLKISDAFINPENLKLKVVGALSQNTIDGIFEKTISEIEFSFDQLKEKLFDIDKTISDASNRYREKINNYLVELKGKAIEAQKKKHEVTLRQIDKISSNLFPSQNLQEREINFIYYKNKYGKNFIDQLFEELEINKFEHQLINL
jgi:bacillithiol biosynthesis cysteine-adding enzyme BshC